MKKFRLLSALLAILLTIPLLFSLSACSDDEEQNPDDPVGDKTQTETPSLSLNHTELTLYVSDAVKLIPIAKGLDTKSLIYGSTLPSVATVDSDGNVVAVAEGSTVISCRTADEKYVAYCTVVVKKKGDVKPPVQPQLTLDTTAVTLAVGEQRTLSPTLVLPEGVDTTLTYSSTSSVIATVDANGTITAVAAGTASIVVKGAQGLQATCLVTVTGNGGRHVELEHKSLTLTVGDTKKLTATYTTAIVGDDRTLHFTSSLPGVADVDENGVITAKAVGSAVITVSNFNGTANATCTVTVTEKPKATLTLSLSQIILEVDESTTVKATYVPVKETDSKTLTYTSSVPTVASVDATGKITAKAVGSAVITVSNADGTATATCKVTVKAKAIATLTLDKTNLSLNEGASYTLRPTYVPAKETDSRVLYYSTSNSTVATVDTTGKITAKAAGQCNIFVTNKEGTVTAKCHVVVIANSGTEASLKLDIYSLSLITGESKTLHTSYTPASENDSGKLLFSSSSPGIATVDEKGKITAKTAGTTVITVTNETESVHAECTVTVKPAPVKPDVVQKSGSFKTNTGTNLNLLVEWFVTQNEYDGTYVLTANVYLESYSIICGKRTGSSNITIDGNVFKFNTEALNYSGVKEKQKIFFATASVVYEELPDSVHISAIWAFNGSYSGVSIPVLHPQAEVTLK